jgi:hypothetical protein
MTRSSRQPTYRLHKARNCAVVTINGKNHYLGLSPSDRGMGRREHLMSRQTTTALPFSHRGHGAEQYFAGRLVRFIELVDRHASPQAAGSWPQLTGCHGSASGKPRSGSSKASARAQKLSPICSQYGEHRNNREHHKID